MPKVTIELTDEEFKELKELQQNIIEDYANEDIQAKPYIMRIKTIQETPVPDGFNDDCVFMKDGEVWLYGSELNSVNEENLNNFLEENEIDAEDFKEFREGCLFNDDLEFVISAYLTEELNCDEIPIRNERKFEDYYIGITRKDGENYIKYKSHHITGEKPYTFATSGNWELEAVINTFLKIKF